MGARAYVANTLAARVSVIDTATNKVVAEVPGLSFSQGVAVAPDGKHAYATAFATPSGIVSVIDTATNTVVADPGGGGGYSPIGGRHHPGWETRLCRNTGPVFSAGECFGDRHGQQHGGGHGRGGSYTQ